MTQTILQIRNEKIPKTKLNTRPLKLCLQGIEALIASVFFFFFWGGIFFFFFKLRLTSSSKAAAATLHPAAPPSVSYTAAMLECFG